MLYMGAQLSHVNKVGGAELPGLIWNVTQGLGPYFGLLEHNFLYSFNVRKRMNKCIQRQLNDTQTIILDFIALVFIEDTYIFI